MQQISTRTFTQSWALSRPKQSGIWAGSETSCSWLMRRSGSRRWRRWNEGAMVQKRAAKHTSCWNRLAPRLLSYCDRHIFSSRYHEVQKQPWHPQDGSCCSETLRAHHEVKGECPVKGHAKSFIRCVNSGFLIELYHPLYHCSSNSRYWKWLTPAFKSLRSCFQWLATTYRSPAKLHAALHANRLQFPDPCRDSHQNCIVGIVLQMKHRSSLTHTCLCVFPLLSSVCESRHALGQLGLLTTCKLPPPSPLGKPNQTHPWVDKHTLLSSTSQATQKIRFCTLVCTNTPHLHGGEEWMSGLVEWLCMWLITGLDY